MGQFKLSGLFLVLLLTRTGLTQYKYVYYDGDEAEYYTEEDEGGGDEYESEYYEYEYTTDNPESGNEESEKGEVEEYSDRQKNENDSPLEEQTTSSSSQVEQEIEEKKGV